MPMGFIPPWERAWAHPIHRLGARPCPVGSWAAVQGRQVRPSPTLAAREHATHAPEGAQNRPLGSHLCGVRIVLG